MSESENLVREVDELLEQDDKERRLLARLLDKWVDKHDRYFVVRSEMGFSSPDFADRRPLPSFVAVHEMRWVANNIKMGSDMPFMQSKIDQETGRLVIDKDNIEELRQRAPDWTRQSELAEYLLAEPHRKFGSILAVVSPDWVDDPASEFWDEDGRALRNASEFEALDSTGEVGLLDLGATLVYALDGQHRIMGIKGVNDISDGGLYLRTKEGKQKSTFFSKEEICEKLSIDIHEIQSILQEKISVEYIPAVLRGETRKEAIRRIRSVFVAINKHAKQPTTGEVYGLDENDGFAIVARRVATQHPLFQDPSDEGRVEVKKANITGKSGTKIVTLQHLRDSAAAYLQAIDRKYQRWQPILSKNATPRRPDREDLEAAEGLMHALYDYYSTMPIFEALDRGDSLSEWRDFEIDAGEGPSKSGKGHLLTRPIGFTITARAVGELVGIERFTLEDVFDKLIKLDRSGSLQINKPSNVWYGVIFDPSGKKIVARKGAQDLGVRLLKYLIRAAEAPERSDLLEDFIAHRTIEEGLWWGYSGKGEKINLDEIELPKPAR